VGGGGEKMFGVDLSREMDVKVGALGHADQEGTEGPGIVASGTEGGFDFFLRS
jgi:hypothetical protein